MDSAISFAPIANPSARFLILGTMPGMQSLEFSQYYAHPRNAFWRIMADIYGFDANASYPDRVSRLNAAGIAVWDVLQFCVRRGSLDRAIRRKSQIPNDFESFFASHPDVGAVLFNGAAAESAFRKLDIRNPGVRAMSFARLPSSSPAHAVPYDQKLRAWSMALGARSTR